MSDVKERDMLDEYKKLMDEQQKVQQTATNDSALGQQNYNYGGMQHYHFGHGACLCCGRCRCCGQGHGFYPQPWGGGFYYTTGTSIQYQCQIQGQQNT